jgi:hypothetical protein
MEKNDWMAKNYRSCIAYNEKAQLFFARLFDKINR